MNRESAILRIRECGVIPVVRASSAEEATRIVEAVRAGGLSVVEITLTVPGAVQVIERLAAAAGDRFLVGAGTVLDLKAARACVAAGARFVVSPALDEDTIAYCRKHDVVAIPGALTPTEIVRAWSAGADLVKVYPVSAVGGADYVRSLKAPLPQVELVPTGGITLANAASFIEAGAAAIGVGSDLVHGPSARITLAARAYADAVRAARAPRGLQSQPALRSL